MGLLGALFKGAVSPITNGIAAGKAPLIISRITRIPCNSEQIDSLKWWAQRNGQRKYVWNEFEYAFFQMYEDYLSGEGKLYCAFTPQLKERIFIEYQDYKDNGLIRDAYIISLYEPLD